MWLSSVPARRACSPQCARGSAGAACCCSTTPMKPGKKILISRRRALQLHQFRLRARTLPLGQPAFRALRTRALHAARLHRAGATGTASPGTRRRSASCSATDRRAQIVAMLLAECEAAGVDLRLRHRVTDITRAEQFRSRPTIGAFTAASLVLAIGWACPSRRWARPASRMMPHGASAWHVTPIRARPRAAHLRRRGARPDAPARRRRAAGGGAVRHGGLSRGDAVHPSRPVGPCGPAGRRPIGGRARPSPSTCCRSTTPRPRCSPPSEHAPKAEPRTVLATLLPQRLAQSMATLHLPPRVIGEVGDAELKRLGATLKAWRLEPSRQRGLCARPK